MGNNDFRSKKFLQSQNDFPLIVKLGNKKPIFGLSRWKEKNSLSFYPYDNEGFTLRGDKRRFLYKGKRRSHRFTILNDGAFEYDCILLKEPESNTIKMRMEGAEKYDFFKQPEFVPDDFLKGSYAVYRKETIVGQGTGKLCHIHRPLIIDANGRKVWGELSKNGNDLIITIPEKWLSDAKYPVTVDPTVGTSTIGSQTTGPDPNNPYYDRPWLDSEYTLNKFLVPENREIGTCRAYVYTYNENVDSYIKPLLYSNKSNNTPYQRLSKNEKNIDVTIWEQRGLLEGWRSNTFDITSKLTAGTYIWFGLFDGFFTTKFDYGCDCYKTEFDEDAVGYPPSFINIKPWNTFCNIKWSMYFTYSSVLSQSYSRTLTQGVNISENKNIYTEFKRYITQFVEINDDIRNIIKMVRKCFDYANINEIAEKSQKLKKLIIENVLWNDKNNYNILILRIVNDLKYLIDSFKQAKGYIRHIFLKTVVKSDTERRNNLKKIQKENVFVEELHFRHLFMVIKLFSASMVRDVIMKRFLVSKEQIEIKSLITKDLRIESKII